MTITQEYAQFLCSGALDAMPGEVLAEAKSRVLDLLGVAIAGQGLAFSSMAAELMLEMGGTPESTVIGCDRKLPAPNAAFVNAAYGHGLDMDDGHRFANYHPGVCMVPTALAVAEAETSPGADLLKAVVAGYEIASRVGRAINPSHLQRGFHTTGTAGVFGAAAAAGLLMKLTPEQAANALGMAAHCSAGLMQFTMAKPLNTARVAQQGVHCARLARKGAVGSRDIFEGRNGFLAAFADQVDEQALADGLGRRWDMMLSSTKMYACCRHVHAPMDVALGLCADQGLSAGDIASVHVRTYPVALRVCNLELAPRDPHEAKFSLPVSLALGLCNGQAGPDAYVPEKVDSAEVRDLAAKIRVDISPQWEQEYPRHRGVTVTIATTDGREFSRSQPLPKGEAELPFSERDIAAKFLNNAGRLFPADACARMLDTIMGLDRLPASELAAQLAAPR